MDDDALELTRKYWNDNLVRYQERPTVVHWWDSPLATRLYRDLYRADDRGSDVRAINLLLEDYAPRRTFSKAISFGSGVGWKELQLMKLGFVDHFTLVELSNQLCEEAALRAEKLGLSQRVSIVPAPFQDFDSISGSFDLVYWDAALHHMSDTRDAVKRSRDLLSSGGVFVMDDYVGATFNQHNARLYDLADRLRSKLPSSWFNGDNPVPLSLGRYAIEDVLASDPTEAADSGSILSALADLLPGVVIIPMGGVFYALACREMFGMFDELNPAHAALLEMIFEYERQARVSAPETSLQALAFWQKGESTSVGVSSWIHCIPGRYRDPLS